MEQRAALALMKRMKREMAEVQREIKRIGKTKYGSSDVPHGFWVVTRDGKSFGVMYFTGAYSSYRESVIMTEDEWDSPDAEWKKDAAGARSYAEYKSRLPESLRKVL